MTFNSVARRQLFPVRLYARLAVYLSGDLKASFTHHESRAVLVSLRRAESVIPLAKPLTSKPSGMTPEADALLDRFFGSSGSFTPAFQFNDARNSQYLPFV